MEDNYDFSKLKKKKKVNSRAKGSTFERQIAKLLNNRFIYGDLITPIKFKYCIECKKGYNKENLYSLYNYSSDTWKFIDQCQKDSDKCDKIPMVIFKQDRPPTLAIVPSNIPYQATNFIEIYKEGKVYRVYLFDDLLKEADSCWLE